MKRRYLFLLCFGAAVLLALLCGRAAPSGRPAAPQTAEVPAEPGIALAPDETAGEGPEEAAGEEPAPLPAAEEPGQPGQEPAEGAEAGTEDPEEAADPAAEPDQMLYYAPGAAHMVAGADYDFSQPVPETEPVDEEYFADAVFLGDSRTDGFHLFSGLSQGDYIVKTGLSVFKVEKEQVKIDGKKVTVFQALGRREYGKVYLCLGLNELGMRDDQGYYDHYAALIDQVRQIQPGATIYVQLLIPVNAQKCAEKKMASYINNEQIAVYNGLLVQLAQDKQVFLADPAQAIVDETGQPPYQAVADGVHFQKEAYEQWLDYLKRHTVNKGEWA